MHAAAAARIDTAQSASSRELQRYKPQVRVIHKLAQTQVGLNLTGYVGLNYTGLTPS